MSEETTLPAKVSELRTGGAIKAVVPQSMDDAYRLAKAVCMSGLAPRGLEKPEAAMVAILHGLEIGLTPMMALQKIAVINGRPTLWGDGALGLVRSSGLCKYVQEQLTGTGDNRVATCETQRAGEPTPIMRSFSVSDAKRAGLWDKQGPWKQFPERMLQMRARAFALRDGYADVLGGMYLAEELQGSEPEKSPQAEAPQPPAAPPTPPPAPPRAPVVSKPEPAQQTGFHDGSPIVVEGKTDVPVATVTVIDSDQDYRDWIEDSLSELAECKTEAAVEDLRDRVLLELRDDDITGWKSATADKATELFNAKKRN